MDYIIYHNPRCRKSRETLEILSENGIEPKVVRYLDEPLGVDQLDQLCRKLGIEASQLLRKNEAIFKEKFSGEKMEHQKALRAMADHPKLMERPIVVKGNKAVIGRPPQKVLELIS
ncbi:MAG: arsenate reductase (glutaredoxin) [Saprospirales bacterium]|nr:MAG: arsenate reductase (glutaredoxin) [Saprospirales bacterium]